MSTAGQIDVWIVKTHTVTEEERLTFEAALNDSEYSRLNKFRIEDAKLQFLIARCLVRSAFSSYERKRPVDWTFVENSYGRPRLAEGQITEPLYFNVSHTSGMVVCAFSRSEEIGIDIERVDRKMDFLGLAQQVFSGSEISSLVSASGMERREVFFGHWTLKEAYIKARGMGLSLPMKEFWFKLGENSQKIYFSQELLDDPEKWQFKRLSPTKNHRLAIAASFWPQQVSMRVNIRNVSISDIAVMLESSLI